MGASYYKKGDKKIPKKDFYWKFHNEDQWGNQEQEWTTSSGRTHHRSWENEEGGDEQKTEKNGDVFRGRPRPGRSCSAIDVWVDAWNWSERVRCLIDAFLYVVLIN
jgi:hypothetical protein